MDHGRRNSERLEKQLSEKLESLTNMEFISKLHGPITVLAQSYYTRGMTIDSKHINNGNSRLKKRTSHSMHSKNTVEEVSHLRNSTVVEKCICGEC